MLAVTLHESYKESYRASQQTYVEKRVNILSDNNSLFRKAIATFPDKVEHVHGLLRAAAGSGCGECRVRSYEFLDEEFAPVEKELVEVFLRFIDVPGKVETATNCEKSGNDSYKITKSWNNYVLVFHWRDL